MDSGFFLTMFLSPKIGSLNLGVVHIFHRLVLDNHTSSIEQKAQGFIGQIQSVPFNHHWHLS